MKSMEFPVPLPKHNSENTEDFRFDLSDLFL